MASRGNRSSWPRQRGVVRVIPALCGCYASFIRCYSAAILLLFCCCSAAILLLLCCYSAAILALFQLYSFVPCFMPGSKPPHHQHSSNNQQQQQNPNDPKQRQRNQGNTDRQADRQGGGGARSPARPPLVFLCLFSAEAEEPVGRLNIPGPSDRRPSPRARPPRARHSIDGQSPFTPRATPAPMPGSVALVRDHHVVARTRAPPLASLDLTAITISRRRCRVEIHASAPSQGATSN